MYLHFNLSLHCFFTVRFLHCYLRGEISKSWVWTPSDWSKSITEVGAMWQIWFLTWAQLLGELKAVGIWVEGFPVESTLGPNTMRIATVAACLAKLEAGNTRSLTSWESLLLWTSRVTFKNQKLCRSSEKETNFSCQINRNLNFEGQSRSKTWLCRYILFLQGLVHETLASS